MIKYNVLLIMSKTFMRYCPQIQCFADNISLESIYLKHKIRGPGDGTACSEPITMCKDQALRP